MLLGAGLSCITSLILLIAAVVVSTTEAKPWSNTETTSSSPYSPASLLTAKVATRSNCQSHCGELYVPYPFGIGIGSGCSMDKQFDIHCDTSHNPPKAYLNVTIANLEVLGISDTQLRVRNNVAQSCPGFRARGLKVNQTNRFFSISETANEFTFVGCSKFVTFMVLHENTTTDTRTFIRGCVSWCTNREDVKAGACSGIGCCRTSFPRGSTVFYALISNVSVDETVVWAYSGCNYVFMGEKGKFNFKGLEDLENSRFAKRVKDTVPMVLEWTVSKDYDLQVGTRKR